MKIEVNAKIHPSEDPDKVTEAVENIFPEINLSVEENQVKGKSTNKNSLEKLKNKIGLQAIRDTARKELEKIEKKIYSIFTKQTGGNRRQSEFLYRRNSIRIN